ncbi:aldose epimerase family protein [Verrucomicrobiales bacterium BCK34]|nr:aldose epimerase family protein [Verrucomicrobiales bacterium BCK34]
MIKLPHFGAISILILITQYGSVNAQTSKVVPWTSTEEQHGTSLFVLTNSIGTRVTVAEYGALLVSIETADRDGKLENITLSYQTEEEARAGGAFGSVIGRFANRIDGGGFTIDDTFYPLETVNEKTGVHIHGGKTGFQRQLWSGLHGVDKEGAFARLELTSEDGHEGYPGNIRVTVTYRLNEENTLSITYDGSTDAPTHLNLTNHAYFNLAGGGTILNHSLKLESDEYLEIDERNIPTGLRLPVENTPFDFTTEKPVGADIEAIAVGGYDHCFVIREDNPDSEVIPFATLTDPSSGRTLNIATTKPGVQIFTANHFKGNPFPKWGGICFETQFYPDTPNKPDFPSSLLRPGEPYQHTTEFRFGVMK